MAYRHGSSLARPAITRRTTSHARGVEASSHGRRCERGKHARADSSVHFRPLATTLKDREEDGVRRLALTLHIKGAELRLGMHRNAPNPINQGISVQAQIPWNSLI